MTTVRGSLREDARDRTRARIVDGVMAAMVEGGLDVTVDDVAAAACVSRRTIFRHFSTHGELLAAGIRETLHVLAKAAPAPPALDADVRVWLVDSSIAIHQMLRDLVGRTFWDIHVVRAGRPPEVTDALEGMTEFRGRIMRDLAAGAWIALGAPDTPPEWVVSAFALQLSGFSTNFLSSFSCEEAGRQSARVLWATLCDARLEQDGRAGTLRPH